MKRAVLGSVWFISMFLICVQVPLAMTLDSLLQRHYAAIGGREKCMTVRSYEVRARFISADGGWKKKMVMYTKNDKVRSDMIIQPGMSSVRSFDGSSGWNISPWSGSLDAQPLNAADAKDLSTYPNHVKSDLVVGSDATRSLKYKGVEDYDGSECHVVVVNHQDGLQREFFIDTDSYLVVKVTTKYRFMDADHESILVYSNYKKTEGIMLPTAIEYGEGGGGAYVDEYVLNASLDDALFVMPAPASK